MDPLMTADTLRIRYGYRRNNVVTNGDGAVLGTVEFVRLDGDNQPVPNYMRSHPDTRLTVRDAEGEIVCTVEQDGRSSMPTAMATHGRESLSWWGGDDGTRTHDPLLAKQVL